MTFSICIPNYNYEAYIGQAIQSVLDQSHEDFEVVVRDNASPDRSVEVVEALGDPRVSVTVNSCNVGFAGNLDRAVEMATSDRLLMLSSDDLMKPGALEHFHRLYEALGDRGDQCIVTAGSDVVDSDGGFLRTRTYNPQIWRKTREEAELSQIVGARVISADAGDLLREALLLLRNPLHFVSTMYSRQLHEAVGGYGGARLINPDKWFNWKMLGVADRVYFIDKTLFSYRWHQNNQAAIQKKSGALKHLVDQYVATFDLPAFSLDRAGLTRDDLAAAFVEQDVALRGLKALANGDAQLAARGVRFGQAAYPHQAARNWKLWALRALLKTGPAGQRLARLGQATGERRWRASGSAHAR